MMGDPDPPGKWRLDWRDLRNYRVGGRTKPPIQHKRFKSETGAVRELARLSADPGAAIEGFIAFSPGKPPPMEQVDFGWPVAAGPYRVTD